MSSVKHEYVCLSILHVLCRDSHGTFSTPRLSVLSPPNSPFVSTAFAYGEFVVLWVVFYTDNFVVVNAVIYTFLTVMAVWAHLKTMLTEPAVVPRAALPLREEGEGSSTVNHTLCGRCESYKPTR